MLRRALEALAQLRILRRDADRHVFVWQARIMMQPVAISGAVEKPHLVGAEQRRDHDVAAGLELAVGLTQMRLRRSLSTSVCWVSARPISHGMPAWIELSGDAPVPPSWPEISTWSAFDAATLGRDRADADLAHQLHRDPRRRIAQRRS